MLMIYMGGFISTASHGQTFLSPPAKPGVYLFDYYVAASLRLWLGFVKEYSA